MQFNSLKKGYVQQPKVKKADQPINLAVRLERIEVNTDRPSLFHGFEVATNEPVTVRMMSVDEGVVVNLRKDEDRDACKTRLQSSYVGQGEKHRPRPSEIANPNHKTHCQPGGLLMFTKTLKGDDGVYRAHWVETLENAPGAGCDSVMASIKIVEQKDPNDRTKVTGHVVAADIVNPDKAAILDKENVLPFLTSTFANRDGDVKRKPFMLVRLINKEDGNLVLDPARINAKYDPVEINNPDAGMKYTAYEAATAMDSVKHLMRPDHDTPDGLVVRAALFGLGKEPGYPAYDETKINADQLADLKQITDAVRDGLLIVEAIPGERISAGPATRASILKAVKDSPNNPINTVYVKKDDNGRPIAQKFCPTYLTTKVGADGHRMFTKVQTVECYPKSVTVKAMATANDHKANAEAAKRRVAEAAAAEVESLPFDPTAIDGSDHDDINTKLTQSAVALEADM